MNRIAFVIPWFGRDLVGGAEQHVFQVGPRVVARDDRGAYSPCGRLTGPRSDTHSAIGAAVSSASASSTVS